MHGTINIKYSVSLSNLIPVSLTMKLNCVRCWWHWMPHVLSQTILFHLGKTKGRNWSGSILDGILFSFSDKWV